MNRPHACCRLGVLVILSCLASAFHPATSAASNLPPEPKGFSWRSVKSLQAAFLVPEQWFVKEEAKGETSALFITKESIKAQGSFQTGFSVNAIRRFAHTSGVSPSIYATQWIQKMTQSSESAWGVGPAGDQVHLRGAGGFFIHRSQHGAGNLVMRALALGNDRTGTLYLIMFESPEAEWERAKAIGAVIMDNLVLSPEF